MGFQFSADRVQGHHAVGVHRQPHNGGSLVLFQPLDRVLDRVVLNRRAEDTGAGRVGVAAGPVQALHCQVVRLGAAGSKDDFRGMAPGGGGQGFARFLHHHPGAAA